MTKEQWIEIMRRASLIEEVAQKFLKSPPTKQTILYEARKIKELMQEIIPSK